MMWNFDAFPERDALITDGGERMTYSVLQTEGEKLARVVGARCLVFSLCTNALGAVVGYTAFLNHGIVPMLLNAHMDVELFRHLMAVYEPAYVWMPGEETGKIGNFEQTDAENSDVVQIAAALSEFETVYTAYGYSLLRNPYALGAPLHRDLALLLTTSGSTGSQKFVRQSYRNIEVNTAQIAEYLELTASERPITTLPMNYTYGCSIINTHLSVGATILLTDRSLMEREFWAFLRDKRATSIAGVPYTYEMLDKLRFSRMNLPYLMTMTQAGGKLSPELQRKYAEFACDTGKRFFVMYGACEATARMGYLPPNRAIEKYGSCGIPIPGGCFSLIDADGQEITEADVTGELVYEGENVTLGYAEGPEDLAKGDERHGRLMTGDMAKRDADGFYYIVGRKKRFLKVFGNRVNLDEIDRLIKAGFKFMDCASAGVDDHVYLFITDETKLDDVKRYIAEKTKLNPSAFTAVALDAIPKNDSGKVLYPELEKYYL